MYIANKADGGLLKVGSLLKSRRSFASAILALPDFPNVVLKKLDWICNPIPNKKGFAILIKPKVTIN